MRLFKRRKAGVMRDGMTKDEMERLMRLEDNDILWGIFAKIARGMESEVVDCFANRRGRAEVARGQLKAIDDYVSEVENMKLNVKEARAAMLREQSQ